MDQAARYSVQERIKIVDAYLATKPAVQTQQQFRRDFPGRRQTMFEAVSKEIHEMFISGDRSFKQFSNAHNAPGSSPVSI